MANQYTDNDEFCTFKNQSKKRLAYYNKCKYDITIYDLDGTNYKYTKKNSKRSKEKKDKKIEDIDECLL